MALASHPFGVGGFQHGRSPNETRACCQMAARASSGEALVRGSQNDEVCVCGRPGAPRS